MPMNQKFNSIGYNSLDVSDALTEVAPPRFRYVIESPYYRDLLREMEALDSQRSLILRKIARLNAIIPDDSSEEAYKYTLTIVSPDARMAELETMRAKTNRLLARLRS